MKPTSTVQKQTQKVFFFLKFCYIFTQIQRFQTLSCDAKNYQSIGRRHFSTSLVTDFALQKYSKIFQLIFTSSSKFQASRRIFTNLDDVSGDDPIYIEPTTSRTRYLFLKPGQISQAKLSELAQTKDDSDSSDEEDESDDEGDESDAHTAAARANAYPKIVFLGTGSSYAGATKTVTAILVQTT